MATLLLAQVATEYGVLSGASFTRLINQATNFASDNLLWIIGGVVCLYLFGSLLNRV